jgi:hypothetical protein
MPPLLPILIAVHVALALALLVPSVLLPFAFRRRAIAEGATPGRTRRVLLALQTRGTPVIGLGLAVTGFGLLAILGFDLLSRPWLLVALAIYAVNLVLAFFVQRPELRRMVGLRPSDDPAGWTIRARRQRYLSYLMAGLIGAVGFLMSTKPVLW